MVHDLKEGTWYVVWNERIRDLNKNKILMLNQF